MSGGTEANALALTPGLRRGAGEPVRRLLVSAVEHTSVLSGGRFSPETITTIAITGSGLVDVDHLRGLLADGPPALVSVMLANNETGALQPVGEVADIVHEAGGLLHVDAIQALGKIPFDIKSLRADLITLSAHKVGGPKGVGALVLADEAQGLEPLLRGGGQELGRRAGTENVAGIAAFGAAVRQRPRRCWRGRPRPAGALGVPRHGPRTDCRPCPRRPPSPASPRGEAASSHSSRDRPGQAFPYDITYIRQQLARAPASRRGKMPYGNWGSRRRLQSSPNALNRL